MNKKVMILGLGLAFTVACLGATPISSDAVGTQVAKQLTSMAALTRTKLQNATTAQENGNTPEGQLPSVTPTVTLPPSPSPTVSPTRTPTLTNTPPADDPRLSLGTPSYRTDFPDGTNWYVYEDDNVKFEAVDHKFVMTAKQANGYDSWTFAAGNLTNYYLEMTATTDTCSGRDRYGLVVGVPYPANNPSYLMRVSCDGYYSFSYFNNDPSDNKYHFLTNWTKSSYIYAGSNQTNRVGFKAEGTHLTLYANGHFLSELTEPDFGEGRFGLAVGSVSTVNFVVRVSEVAYWKLP
ncbi:MAG: hypothetical protein ABSC61_05495 [Anaerolineales bacterium]